MKIKFIIKAKFLSRCCNANNTNSCYLRSVIFSVVIVLFSLLGYGQQIEKEEKGLDKEINKIQDYKSEFDPTVDISESAKMSMNDTEKLRMAERLMDSLYLAIDRLIINKINHSRYPSTKEYFLHCQNILKRSQEIWKEYERLEVAANTMYVYRGRDEIDESAVCYWISTLSRARWLMSFKKNLLSRK